MIDEIYLHVWMIDEIYLHVWMIDEIYLHVWMIEEIHQRPTPHKYITQQHRVIYLRNNNQELLRAWIIEEIHQRPTPHKYINGQESRNIFTQQQCRNYYTAG